MYFLIKNVNIIFIFFNVRNFRKNLYKDINNSRRKKLLISSIEAIWTFINNKLYLVFSDPINKLYYFFIY